MSAVTSRPRVLFVGLDAMDPDLLRAWAEEGALPALARLLREGASAPTRNPPGLYIGALWPTFFTATSPVRHGRYCFEQWVPGTYRTRRVSPEDVAEPPFWVALGEAGRRACVVDVPHAEVRAPKDGVHLADWGTHDAQPAGFRGAPKEVVDRVLSEFGRDPVGPCDARRTTAGEVAAFRDRLVERVATKARLARRLLAEGPWDLFAVVFGDSHCAGHQLWHVHDAGHARHDPEVVRALGDPLKDVYRALDAAVATLLEDAGPSATTFVLASHGMGPHHDGNRVVEEVLRRIDATHRGGRAPALSARLARLLDRPRLHRLDRRLCGRLRIPRSRSHGRAFVVPNNDEWVALRANVVGREPHGRVAPEDLDAYLATLAADLRQVVDADTGEPVFREVLRTSEVYPAGPRAGALPDLLLAWSRRKALSAVESPKIGRVEGKYRGPRTGDHRPEGLLVARGPGIAPGRLPPVAVEDVAPTLCARLRVALPRVDGRPVPAFLSREPALPTRE
jgi:predicted AlkP superfamily phosphohydrolase/phosphomutase